MRNPAAPARTAAIVLGCGETGSAVALALHLAGFAVVLVDEADPAWHRRGMAFTNAWYVGNAELDGEGVCFCASLRSIPSVLSRRMIAATTWSWPGVTAALAPRVLVDTRRRRRRGSEILLDRVPLAIGIGEDFVEGENVHVAMEPATDPATERFQAGPGLRQIASPAHVDARIQGFAVEAKRHGRFMTERRIGDVVRTGHVVGGLGNETIVAPASGALIGLAARGARIEPGDPLVEVDPAGIASRCHGLAAGSRQLAERVLAALARHGVPARAGIASIFTPDAGLPGESVESRARTSTAVPP